MLAILHLLSLSSTYNAILDRLNKILEFIIANELMVKIENQFK